MSPRGTHPAVEQLVAWLDGELPFLRRALVDRHLRDCRECRERVGGLDATVGAVRQLILGVDGEDKVAVARARWRFREAVRELEPRSVSSRRAPLVAALAAAAGVLIWMWIASLHPPAPVANERAALAKVESVENTGYASAVREDQFEAEMVAKPGRPARREFRVWSAPRRQEFAARGTDRSGAVRFAVYASASRPEVVYSPGLLPAPRGAGGRLSLLRAVERAEDLEALESGFWTWLRGQVWEPVSLARETAEFASLGGVRLTVERQGEMTVWRAERGDAQRAAMELAVGADGVPRSMDLAWGAADSRRSIRISRVGRLNYGDYQAAAIYFHPEAPARTAPPVAPVLPVPEASGTREEQLPATAALRAAEVRTLGLLHRLHLCVSGEVRVVRTERAVEVSGMVASEDRRAQLLGLFSALPESHVLRLDLRTAARPVAAAVAEVAVRSGGKMEPAPGEAWLRDHLRVGDASTRQNLPEAMNRLVQAALAISSDGWALRHLAERFPEEVERDLPEPEQRLLRSIAEDHAIAVESQVASVAGVLGYGFPDGVEATEPAPGRWQPVAARLHTAAQKSSSALLRFFAAGERNGAPLDFTAADAAATERDLRALAASAGRLRSDIRTASASRNQ